VVKGGGRSGGGGETGIGSKGGSLKEGWYLAQVNKKRNKNRGFEVAKQVDGLGRKNGGSHGQIAGGE